MPSAQVADLYWKLLGEMQTRYLADLLALKGVLRELDAPPVSLSAEVRPLPNPPPSRLCPSRPRCAPSQSPSRSYCCYMFSVAGACLLSCLELRNLRCG